jgi:DNA polymerase-4
MLAVWAPDLPFQLARLREPALSSRPVAFRSPEADRTPRLWMVDRWAKRVGLEPGLPVDVALHQDPGLVVLDPEPSTWMDARAFLGQQLLSFSPLGRLGRLGEGFVDLSGTERIHGPVLDTAERLRRNLRERAGWEVHGGLSRSLSASRLAARAEDHVRLIEEGGEARFLGPFPLSALPSLEARSRERLRTFGLHQVNQVQPMELVSLGRIIPPTEAFQVLRQARGEDQERLPLLERPQASVTLRQVFHPPQHRHEITLACWLQKAAWEWRLDGQFIHKVQLRWWDFDELSHHVNVVFQGEDLRAFCREVEIQFHAEATRRVLIQRLELEAWLGDTAAVRPLILEEDTQKSLALEVATLHIHRRFGGNALRRGI